MMSDSVEQKLHQRKMLKRKILITGIIGAVFIVIGATLVLMQDDDLRTSQYPIVVNERGNFYMVSENTGIIGSAKSYDGFYQLFPVESGNICTFDSTFFYQSCLEVYGEEGLKLEAVKQCSSHNHDGLRLTDTSCVDIYTFGWVDDFNRAVNEHELEYTDWSIYL